MKTYSLTCESKECENANIAIEMVTDAQMFICGVCLNEIVNVVELKPEAKSKK